MTLLLQQLFWNKRIEKLFYTVYYFIHQDLEATNSIILSIIFKSAFQSPTPSSPTQPPPNPHLFPLKDQKAFILLKGYFSIKKIFKFSLPGSCVQIHPFLSQPHPTPAVFVIKNC